MTDTADTKGKETAAAVGFAAVLALAAGGAGIVVAALAVGLQRAWQGHTDDRPRAAQLRRDRIADHRAWLEQDAKREQAWRAARRQWWSDGADPASQPQGPSLATRLGRWCRRAAARSAIRWDDFKAGFAEGARAASQVRRDGGSFREVARARPHHDTDDTVGEPDPEGGALSPPEPVNEPDDVSKVVVEPEPEPVRINYPHLINEQPPRQSNRNTKPRGDTMGSTATQSESNAVVMRGHLEGIKTELQLINDAIDQLSKQRDILHQKVENAAEFAELTGQTTQTKEALDAAGGVVTGLGQQVGAASDSVAEADEQTTSAVEGLTQVEHAEDALTAAGADGRAVAPATAA